MPLKLLKCPRTAHSGRRDRSSVVKGHTERDCTCLTDPPGREDHKILLSGLLGSTHVLHVATNRHPDDPQSATSTPGIAASVNANRPHVTTPAFRDDLGFSIATPLIHWRSNSPCSCRRRHIDNSSALYAQSSRPVSLFSATDETSWRQIATSFSSRVQSAPKRVASRSRSPPISATCRSAFTHFAIGVNASRLR